MQFTSPFFLMGVLFLISIFAPIEKEVNEAEVILFKLATYPNQPGTLTRNWFLSQGYLALQVVALYLAIVFLGLSNKKKGESQGQVSPTLDSLVKNISTVYNLAQCILCCYMMYKAVEEYIQQDYVPICNKFDVNSSGMAKVLQVFYLSKVLDFCDSIFIILRKKMETTQFSSYLSSCFYLFILLVIDKCGL